MYFLYRIIDKKDGVVLRHGVSDAVKNEEEARENIFNCLNRRPYYKENCVWEVWIGSDRDAKGR